MYANFLKYIFKIFWEINQLGTNGQL